MGYQRFTFPLAVYGCLDTASRRLLWLRVWTDNCDPKLVARWYFDYLYDRRVIASIIRVDKGTETGDMATLHLITDRKMVARITRSLGKVLQAEIEVV
jgi:hypothetical protein